MKTGRLKDLVMPAGEPRVNGTLEAVVMIPVSTKTLTEGKFDFAVTPN